MARSLSLSLATLPTQGFDPESELPGGRTVTQAEIYSGIDHAYQVQMQLSKLRIRPDRITATPLLPLPLSSERCVQSRPEGGPICEA